MARSTYRSQDIDALVRRQQEQEEKRRRRSGYTADDVRSMLGDVPYAAPERERRQDEAPAVRSTSGGYTAADVRSMLGDVPYAAPERERRQDETPAVRSTSGGYTAADVRDMLGDATPGGTAATTGRVDMNSPAATALQQEPDEEPGMGVLDWWRERSRLANERSTIAAGAAQGNTTPATAQALADIEAQEKDLPGLGEALRNSYDNWQRRREQKKQEEQAEAESTAPAVQRSALDRLGLDARGLLQQAAGSYQTLGEMMKDPQVWTDYARDVNVRESERAQRELSGRFGPETDEALRTLAERAREEDEANPEKVYTPENSAGVRRYMEGAENIEKALEGMTGPARFAAETANSVVSNAPNMALAAIPVVGTALSLGTMGAQAAGARAAELSSEGNSAADTLGRSLASGAIEIATESVPVGNWAEILRGNGKSAVRNILTQMGEEGTEEAVSYLANYAADMAAQDPNAEFSLEELLESAGMGAASGGIYGGVGVGINRLANLRSGTQAAAEAATAEADTVTPAERQSQQSAAEAEQAARLGAAQNVQQGAAPGEGDSLPDPHPSAQGADTFPLGERQDGMAETARTVERAATGDPEAMREALNIYESQRAEQATAAEPAPAMTPEEAVRADPRFAAEEGVRLTPAQQRLYDAGTETLGMTGQAAQRMAESWDGKADADTYLRGWQSLYRAGQLGLAENSEQALRLAGEPAAALDQYSQRLAFGQGAAEAAVYPFSRSAQNLQAVADAADNDAHYTDAMREAVKTGYKGQAPTVYMQAVNGMYDAGRTGSMTYEQALDANRTAAMAVDDAELLRGVYDLGTASVQAETAPAAVPLGRAAGGGTVTYTGTDRAGAQVPGELLNAAAHVFGVDVEVVRQATDGSGQEVNGGFAAGIARLTLGENSRNGYQTLVHELTHYMESVNPEGWGHLRNKALAFYTSEQGMGAAQNVLERYGASYDGAAIGADEFARDFWSGLLSSEDNMRAFLEYLSEDSSTAPAEKRTILQALRDILDRVVEHLRGLLRGGDATTGAAEGRRLAEQAETAERCRDMVQEFLDELESARQNNTRRTEARRGGVQQNAAEQNAASEDVRLSIRTDAEGPYVEVDKDQHIFDNLAKDDIPGRIKALARYMRENFKGKVFPVAQDRAYVGTKGIDEYGHPATHRRMGTQLYNAKLRAGTSLDELLQVSEFVKHEDDTGHHKEATGGWDYYRTVFHVDGDFYEGRVAVKVTDRGREFYDITKIRKTTRNDSQSNNTVLPAASAGGLSNNTITESGENVKHSRRITDQGERYSRPVTGDDRRPVSERLEEAREELRDVQQQRQALKQEREEYDSQPRFQAMLAERPAGGGRGLLDWLRKWRDTAEYKERNEWMRKNSERDEELSKREYDLSKRMRKLQDEEQNERWRQSVQEEQAAYDEAVQDSGLEPEEYRRDLALDTYGTTEDFNEAGYILPSGDMLDFSDHMEPGKRAVDHRDIEDVFGPAELGRDDQGVKAMNAFIADGNVRVMAGTPGVDISSVSIPSEAQLEKIEEMADELGAAQRKFGLDISDPEGRQVDNKWYEGRVRGARVVQDIRAYFETGTLPESDQLDAFRYSRDVDAGGETDTEARTRLERENQELAWQVSNMQEQLARVRAEMKLSEGHTFSRSAIRGVASRILTEYESRYDRATLERELEQIFAHIADGGPDTSYKEAMQTCTNLMRDVIKQSSRVSTELRDYYRPIREALRGTTVEVKEGSPIYYDLLDAFGDGEDGKRWGNVRRATFGRLNLKLVQSAGNADTYFAELAQQYPAVFDADAHPVENIRKALGVFEAGQPVYENPYGLDIESMAAFAGQELFEAYMMTPESHSPEDRHRKQMLRLRGEMIQQRQAALERQKASYEKKLAELRRQNRQRVGDVRDEMYGKMNDRLLKQKAVFEQRMERREEQQRWRQARDGVQKSVRRLQRWLQNPTDQAHVPERMRKAVLDLLTSFDWNTSRDGTRAARDWRLAMKDLQVMALEMDNPDRAGDLEYIDFDPDLSETINELIEAGKGAGQIRALNAVQMQQLRGVLESVTRSITEANKLMAGEQMRDLQAVAEGSIIEMEQAKGQQLRAKNKLVAAVTDTAAAERVSQLLGPDMMDAGYYFRTLGPKAESVYRNIRAGFDKRVWHLREAQEKMAEILKGHDVSTWTGPKAQARDFEVGGVHIKLTPGQIMELYCLTQREQAKEHLLQGGITVDEPGGKRRGPRVRLTPESLAEIVGTLTPEQVKMAQRMQAYLSADVASWGNEVSMKQYGVRKFNEPHYWPIKSNQNFTRTSDATVNDAGLWGIKNKGMTKATVKGANNPIVLHDAFDTWAGHVAEMATYNAWCIPLSDAMKWYNYRGQNEISVKEAIENLYGKKGQNFFVQLMKDINGTDSRGGGTFADTWGTLQSRWKVAKVGFNLRVAVQQPTAYFRAGAVLNPKYLAGALEKAPAEVGRGMREAVKYCAIAQWKNWGYFETNIGQSMRSILTGEKSFMEKVQDKSTALAELGDSVTWGTLWLACEDDVRDRAPDLAPGSDAFKQAVAERLSEVIDRTQVVDTVLHRSQIMRSKDTLAKWATNFMAEPTKSYNMLREAAVDMAQGKQGARAKFARTFVTFTVTALATAAGAGLIDAMRSAPDEPDKKYGERWLDALGENFIDNLNILNELPFVKDILSLLQGYDVSRNDMEATADTIDAAAMWLKTFDGKGEATTYKLIYRTANALSEWTGLPVGGLVRDAKSLYDLFTGLQDPLLLDEKVIKSNADMNKALARGNVARAQKLYEELVQKKLDDGKTAKEARSAIRSSLTSYWKPLYTEADSTERREIEKKLLALGYDGVAVYDKDDFEKWLK